MTNRFGLPILLVFALCVPQSIVPARAYMPKFAVLKQYVKKLPRPSLKAPSFKTMKLLSKTVAHKLKENWEDAAALAVIFTIAGLAYKYWGTDQLIEKRYKKEIDMHLVQLKYMSEDRDAKINLRSYTTMHWPNFGDEERDEKVYYVSKWPNQKIKHVIDRGLFLDSHEAEIVNIPAAERQEEDPQGQTRLAAEYQEELKQLDAKNRIREARIARAKNSPDSPDRPGLGLFPVFKKPTKRRNSI